METWLTCPCAVLDGSARYLTAFLMVVGLESYALYFAQIAGGSFVAKRRYRRYANRCSGGKWNRTKHERRLRQKRSLEIVPGSFMPLSGLHSYHLLANASRRRSSCCDSPFKRSRPQRRLVLNRFMQRGYLTAVRISNPTKSNNSM